MCHTILEFHKTEHFVYRQWDRNTDDSYLRKILPHIPTNRCNKLISIVTPSFQGSHNIACNDNKCLILISKGKLLITLFSCPDPDFLFEKERGMDFTVLY